MGGARTFRGMRRPLPLLSLLLLLAACAPAAPGPAPESWIGRSEGDLVAGLGVPHRTMDQPDRRLLAYDGTGVGRAAVVPSIGIGIGGGSGRYGGTGVGTGLGLSFLPGAGGHACTTTFEVQGGRVTGFNRAGPDCD